MAWAAHKKVFIAGDALLIVVREGSEWKACRTHTPRAV
jgi:hypothetical protein